MNYADRDGWTPLICAARGGHQQVVERLGAARGVGPGVIEEDFMGEIGQATSGHGRDPFVC